MKTRKLLAIVLAVAMLASFVSIPVFADGHEGEVLETLGILIGEGDGVTEDYLESMATRAQAALIHLRLFGLEEEALAFEGEDTFEDAATATAYWQPILEYLFANPSLGWQGDGVNFMPTEYVTGQMFTKVLLVALGYVEDVDFTWEEVMDFAETVGLTALADKADVDLTVEDLAMALVEALGTKTTAPTDVTLLTQLVLDGVIDEADAVAAGFEVEEEAVVIVDAYASATDEVTVEMSTDVPDDAVITLKKGTASYAVTVDVDGDMITLTALFNLPAGTYTVMVDDSSAEFEVMAQHAVDLAIGAESVYLADGQDLKVSLVDQYGDAMSLTGTNYSIFNQDDGYVYDPVVTTTMKVDLVSEGSAEAGDTVYVFIYDPGSMLSVSGEVPIIAAPVVTSLAIGGVTPGDEDATMLFEWEDNNVLDVTVYDQYGQEMTLTDSMFDTVIPSLYGADIQVLSSNGDVIPATSWDIIDGEFTFDTEDPGMAMFTLIIPNQAFIATSEMITVYADPVLTSITTAGPDEALYAAEATDFAVAGFDQYGNAMDVTTGDDVTFTATVDLFDVDPNVEATNEIGFTPDMDGTSTVYYFLNGMFQGTFDVIVNPEAYPFQITAVAAPGGIEECWDVDIMSDDITVIDQYGRTMSDPFGSGMYDFDLMTAAATDLFWVGWNGWPDLGFSVNANCGEGTGSASFKAVLIYDGWQVMTESAFLFDIMYVETEDVDGFAMTAIDGPMYTGSTFDFSQTPDEYWKYVKVTGMYGDMTVELYDDNGDGLPDLIDIVTSSNDAVEVMTDNILVPEAVQAAAGGTAGTTTIKAWKNGEVVASADLELSKAAPDWTTTTVDWDDGDTAFNQVFFLVDQYGVDLDYLDAVGMMSPDGLIPYLTEHETVVGDDTVYSIIKWNGAVSASWTDVDSDDPLTTPTP
jgi:hypothetical protein